MLNNIIKTQPIVKTVYACGWALLVGVILLVGLTGPARAVTENIQNEGEKPVFNLIFPANAPITMSNMKAIGRPEIRYSAGEQLEYELNSEVVDADDEDSSLKYDVPFDTALALGSERISRNLMGAQLVPSDPLGSTFSAERHSEANKLTSNINAVPKEREDNAQEGEKPLIVGAEKSPFATIALAFFALLGLVSVARRNDI